MMQDPKLPLAPTTTSSPTPSTPATSTPPFDLAYTLGDARLKEQAAGVYHHAFARKLEHLELMPRSPEQAARLIACSLEPGQGVYLLKGGRVLGLLGFDEGGKRRFIRLRFGTLLAEFGLLGGLWRYLWTRLLRLIQQPRAGTLRIEVIAVAPEARGQGLGTRLLEAAFGYARQKGYRTVVLEVVDTNTSARKLYERLGFKTLRFTSYGLVTKRAGFSGAYFMAKKLPF